MGTEQQREHLTKGKAQKIPTTKRKRDRDTEERDRQNKMKEEKKNTHILNNKKHKPPQNDKTKFRLLLFIIVFPLCVAKCLCSQHILGDNFSCSVKNMNSTLF